MRSFATFPLLCTIATAFQVPNGQREPRALPTVDSTVSTRNEFISAAAAFTSTVAATTLLSPSPAQARGRATLEKSYERYAPRIRAGTDFYKRDLRSLVEKNDFAGIKNALAEPPQRQKSDLNKADAGVAERARQAGGFSDARVLVAADLFAGAFSDNSVSSKTKKMQSAVSETRGAIEGMQKIARLALGEESSGGLFGIGGKKPNPNELAKQMRQLYVEGGNSWNKYIMAANEDLALQFDRFQFLG